MHAFQQMCTVFQEHFAELDRPMIKDLVACLEYSVVAVSIKRWNELKNKTVIKTRSTVRSYVSCGSLGWEGLHHNIWGSLSNLLSSFLVEYLNQLLTGCKHC